MFAALLNLTAAVAVGVFLSPAAGIVMACAAASYAVLSGDESDE